MYVRQRQPVAPFVSTAEMMMKFQSSTRKMSLSCISNSTQDNPTESAWRKPQLTITRPKEPKFKTAQRVRPTTVKSSAELEEEMMAKLPQFKARPVNKKVPHNTHSIWQLIMETQTLPAITPLVFNLFF